MQFISVPTDVGEQFGFKDILADLVLLRVLICLVVLPADYLLASLAADVSDNVLASGHVTLQSLASDNVDNGVASSGCCPGGVRIE